MGEPRKEGASLVLNYFDEVGYAGGWCSEGR